MDTRRPDAPLEIAVGAPPARLGAGLWIRVALACAVLAASGVVRARRAEKYDLALKRGMAAPITLSDVPMVLGPWRGEPTEIDPEIAKSTGALQIVTRRYVNQMTGVRLELILLFGRAVDIFTHTPEVCYPSAGYTLQSAVKDRPIEAGETRTRFRTMVYSKGEGARAEYHEVFYSWWYNDQWSLTVGSRKQFERISAMYKVQVDRPLPAGEKVDSTDTSPTESFLNALLPELQKRLEQRSSPAA
jgi:hypothetical protein